MRYTIFVENVNRDKNSEPGPIRAGPTNQAKLSIQT